MEKIYFNSNQVAIFDNIDDIGTNYILFKNPTKKQMEILIKQLFECENSKIALFFEKSEELQKNFYKHFDIVEAAGGLVCSKLSGKYLFILRDGKWDLPKGWREKNESSTENALREVKEECGIKKLSIDRFICTTRHVYLNKKSKLILKKTDWYTMFCEDEKSKAQTEENISECRFFSKNDLGQVLENTYLNILDVIKKVIF